MKVLGIISEYNPFHRGHMYHIAESRRKSGCDYVIVVMSGSFVQRGEPAFFDKFTRAKWALSNGADIVIELPCVSVLSSAEFFADGAVSTLASTGVVNMLSFGSEIDDIGILNNVVGITASAEFKKALSVELASGKTYARSISDALVSAGANSELYEAVSCANSTLGIEYLKAIKRRKLDIKPFAIKRVGVPHDAVAPCGSYSSASYIRDALINNTDLDAIRECTTEDVFSYISSEDLNLSDYNTLFNLLRFKVLTSTPEYLSQINGVSEGLENSIIRAAMNCDSYEEFLFFCKSKRYSMARLRRVMMSILLGIQSIDATTIRELGPKYIRVLGVRKNASALLTAIAKESELPIIIRNSDIHALSAPAYRLHSIDRYSYILRQQLLMCKSGISDEFGERFLTV